MSKYFIKNRFLENLNQCKEVYGALHARFIRSAEGLALVREKYLNGVYGQCPRILCNKQILLPIGLSNELKYSRVKVYCPKCEEIYKPRQKNLEIDGAYFGTSFPQFFLLSYPELNPQSKLLEYEPKLYGFKIYKKKGSQFYKSDEKIANS